MSINNQKIEVTEHDIETVFNEWKHNDELVDGEIRVSLNDPEYAKSSARYFMKLYNELFPEGTPK